MSDGNTEKRRFDANVFSPPVYKHLHQHGPQAITHLLNSRPEDIPHFDLAEMNLICAFGLPGTEDMDIAAMLQLLGVWAQASVGFHSPEYAPVC